MSIRPYKKMASTTAARAVPAVIQTILLAAVIQAVPVIASAVLWNNRYVRPWRQTLF